MNKLKNSVTFFLNPSSEEDKLIILYRYVSLILTSFFYLSTFDAVTFNSKILLISCISISSLLLNYLYIKNGNNKFKVMILLFIEIVTNTIILIFTGGLNSFYIWYSLNTILIIALKLGKIYGWFNLAIYIIFATWIYHFIVHRTSGSIIELLTNQLDLLISLAMITAIIQLLTQYLHKLQVESAELSNANKDLLQLNNKIKESIKNINKLYQSIHLLSTKKDENEFIKSIIKYIGKITNTDNAIFCKFSNHEFIIHSSFFHNALLEEIKKKLLENWNDIQYSDDSIELDIKNRKFILLPVHLNYKNYALVGIELIHDKNSLSYLENISQLRFLAELSSMFLERCDLERINEELIINEEQNRIANAIHDSVLQKLFIVSCSIYEVIKIEGERANEMIHYKLNIIRNTINSAMKDLRDEVYKLSWKKEGMNKFVVDIQKYIDEVRDLSNINIDFDVSSNTELLSVYQKMAIYRIICEGIGNAVRHGKPSNIILNLNIGKHHITLRLKDDGIGFDFTELLQSQKSGLGIHNIRNLIYSLDGEVDFESGKEIGTTIIATIPIHYNICKEGEVL